MRGFIVYRMVAVCCVLAWACSSGEGERLPAVGVVEQPITGDCSTATFGLPCDPDADGAATECEGICWLGTNAAPSCVPIATVGFTTTDMNGRVCGDEVGSDCSKSCENGACVDKNARVGSACRLSLLGSNGCSGECTSLAAGIVLCQPALLPCLEYGRNDCTFTACNFDDNSDGCVDYDLLESTRCDDGDACTEDDACNASGVCEPGPAAAACLPDGGSGGGGNTGGSSNSGGSGGVTGGSGGAATDSGVGARDAGHTSNEAGTAERDAGTRRDGGVGRDGGAAGGGARDSGGAGGSSAGDSGTGDAAAGGTGAGSGSDAAAGSAARDGGAGDTGRTDGGVAIDAAADGRNEADVDYAVYGGACSCRTVPSGGPEGPAGAWFLVGACAWALRRRRVGPRVTSWLVVLVLGTAAGSARADFNADGYTAPAAPGDLLWTERAQAHTGHLIPIARLTLGYADDPLIAVSSSDQSDQRTLVDGQFSVYASAGLVLWGRLQGAVLVPVTVSFADAQALGTQSVDAAGAAIGNTGLDLRYVALDRSAPLELAIGATLRFPGGPGGRFAADDGFGFWPRLLVGKTFGAHDSYVGGSLGPRIRPSGEVGGLDVGSELVATLGGLYALTERVGLTAELATSSGFTDFLSEQQTPVEVTGGARFEIAGIVLAGGVGTGLTRGYGAPDVRMLATVGYAPPAEAARRAAPGPAPVAADAAGDRDGDGVADAVDRCPAEAEDVDGFEDEDGCPDLDNDGDGIPDATDQCPGEAEDPDGWHDEDGCPEADNDGDGLLDAEDSCPNDPETLNGKDDEDGCPDLVRVEAHRLKTLEPIYFEYNRAEIQERSEPLMVEIANVLKTRTDIGKISIEGHTDSRGEDRYNQELSQRRAEAVLKFLTDAGVKPARLSAKGYGETRAVAPNTTDAGRALNRRVEFVFVDKGAPGAE